MDPNRQEARDDKSIHILLSHAGAEKVTKYMADNFDMNNIKESVKETIKLYEACQRSKVVTKKTKEETIKLIATEPGEKIYIDICGSLNETFRKKEIYNRNI